MVNHGNFEPVSARTQNWDPGYEETVLKEAAQEMNELDVAMKEVRLHCIIFTYLINPFNPTIEISILLSDFYTENNGLHLARKV